MCVWFVRGLGALEMSNVERCRVSLETHWQSPKLKNGVSLEREWSTLVQRLPQSILCIAFCYVDIPSLLNLRSSSHHFLSILTFDVYAVLTSSSSSFSSVSSSLSSSSSSSSSLVSSSSSSSSVSSSSSSFLSLRSPTLPYSPTTKSTPTKSTPTTSTPTTTTSKLVARYRSTLPARGSPLPKNAFFNHYRFEVHYKQRMRILGLFPCLRTLILTQTYGTNDAYRNSTESGYPYVYHSLLEIQTVSSLTTLVLPADKCYTDIYHLKSLRELECSTRCLRPNRTTHVYGESKESRYAFPSQLTSLTVIGGGGGRSYENNFLNRIGPFKLLASSCMENLVNLQRLICRTMLYFTLHSVLSICPAVAPLAHIESDDVASSSVGSRIPHSSEPATWNKWSNSTLRILRTVSLESWQTYTNIERLEVQRCVDLCALLRVPYVARAMTSSSSSSSSSSSLSSLDVHYTDTNKNQYGAFHKSVRHLKVKIEALQPFDFSILQSLSTLDLKLCFVQHYPAVFYALMSLNTTGARVTLRLHQNDYPVLLNSEIYLPCVREIRGLPLKLLDAFAIMCPQLEVLDLTTTEPRSLFELSKFAKLHTLTLPHTYFIYWLPYLLVSASSLFKRLNIIDETSSICQSLHEVVKRATESHVEVYICDGVEYDDYVNTEERRMWYSTSPVLES